MTKFITKVGLVLALATASVTAFSPSSYLTHASITRPNIGLSMSAVSAPVSVPAAPRIVLDPLPKVYVYDHCPFCVRVRLALGLKNVKHDIVFLANDDVATPTGLVGKKVAPIFAIPQDDLVMGESLDIIELVDKDSRFGETGYLKPFSDRTDLKAWQKQLKKSGISGHMQRPRYMQTALPEFATKDGRDAFVKNHPVPPYEKAEWKADDFSQELRWEKYAESLAMTDELLPKLNEMLKELDDMIYCEEYCTEGGMCMDDVDLWSRLRSITVIKGVELPSKLKAYMEYYSEKGDMPLYTGMAV
uniref:GST N-terminal domain-containing protein n=1 Tax=Fibrocapsa japonica TaxID=94617 RepID=A0A7S2V214_9STRA|mmetsp:Transcript_2932/g.4314  ORF Transcript_2932/g.4314 Transcript_2932/m.4314 type:complete len:303 (+) Transcript_2932:61-969(+)